MTKKHNRVALIDMDGTLADFDGQMRRDLSAMQGPNEPDPVFGPTDDFHHIEARKNAIKAKPGWWRSLPALPDGFRVLEMLRSHEFRLVILTKGPFKTTAAWSEKVDWCRAYIPDASVTITEDKGLVYGKILVEDWPPYIEQWLEWRERGLVILMDRPWNQDLHHPNVFRYRGQQDDVELGRRLREIPV